MIAQYVKDLKVEFSSYNSNKLIKDLLAGLTVAAVALPLALAFGVASGADAASGLVTAIFSGIIIGFLGGASFQISGPTGTMVAILIPISAKYGFEGVMAVAFFSGITLIFVALFKGGRVVAIIPSAVITGFTAGISIIIAFSQIDNFFGTTSSGETIVQNIASYFSHGFHIQWQPLLFALLAVAIIIFWPKKWAAVLPPSLVAIIITLLLNLFGPFNVAEVGQIPRSIFLENRLSFSFLRPQIFKELFLPGVSVAALAMIESLLSGAAGSKMTKEKFHPDRQLMAQGIGNLIIPFFGGVPATAALARSSVAIRAGLVTRMTSVFHSLALLVSMFLLSPVMSRIPLASLAGVLMVTSWNMNDWKSIKSYFSNKYKIPIAQFLITMLSTVIFNLTVAILIGIALSMILFVVKSSAIEINIANIDERHEEGHNLTEKMSKVKLVYVTGQLFFGSQEQLVSTISSIENVNTIILSVRGVPSIDHSAMVALEELYFELRERGITLLFCGIQPGVKKQFYRSEFNTVVGEENIFNNAVEAIDAIADS